MAVRMMASLAIITSGALLSGCDSTPDPASAESKAAAKAAAADIQKVDEQNSASIKKSSGRNAPVLKNMKGRMGSMSGDEAK
jgi:PBP1b-binding outer membrane lipoprotein LpoB